VGRGRREGEFGGLDERQERFEECWEEGWRGGAVLFWGAVERHRLIGRLVHGVVVCSAIRKDLILDLFLVDARLEVRVRKCRTHTREYLQRKLHSP